MVGFIVIQIGQDMQTADFLIRCSVKCKTIFGLVETKTQNIQISCPGD